MSLHVVKVGEEETPVVVIDGFVSEPDRIIDLAADFAPYPPQNNHYYPGRRHRIKPQDGEAFDYVRAACQGLTGVMKSVYNVTSFEVADAGFSLVTAAPETLQPLQCVPHFDFPDCRSFAVLHFLSRRPAGGTAFYRHVRTGFETITPERLEAYGSARDLDSRELAPPAGYQDGDGNGFVELARIEGFYNRALIYPGWLLHSGVLPTPFNFSPDPRVGRLTGNIFIKSRDTHR